MHGGFGDGVQSAERFVQQRYPVTGQVGAQQGCPLAHTAGQFRRVLLLGALQTKLGKVTAGFCPGFLFGFAGEQQR